MAGPEITDHTAKSHHHPTRCGLNLPHPPALMKLMEGISDMLFLLSLSLSHSLAITVVSLMALLLMSGGDPRSAFPCLCLFKA